jgi:murein L,D-transpeptidase YafK
MSQVKVQVKLLAGMTGMILILFVWAHLRVEPLPNGLRAEKVLVEKSARKLTLLQRDKPLKVYRVELGRTPTGHKEHEGDGRTPEGAYRIDSRKSDSAFHRALHISYPSSRDVQAAQRSGHSPGGAIMIHGIRNGLGWLGRLHRLVDWTAGCIAVTNWEIEEISRAVPDGTPIEIKP